MVKWEAVDDWMVMQVVDVLTEVQVARFVPKKKGYLGSIRAKDEIIRAALIGCLSS